ncbi:tyrosine kinase receptor Cad96Ca-like [Physella acuta]|uniref:tyrosine kinase receptor Cad96Ca-like n=1 Tax=Physella acuta TaxID=109671 RepID=UPI0027DB879D|nr:tyrosine kinase receptor Cad96Ca-like [Physella acuta]
MCLSQTGACARSQTSGWLDAWGTLTTTTGRPSTKSDVWAYGILLWEIVTLGASPYPGLSAQDVFKFVSAGKKMEKPQHCSSVIYEFMCSCWSFLPENRPTFDALCRRFETLQEKEKDYINLELFQSEQYACLDADIMDEKL